MDNELEVYETSAEAILATEMDHKTQVSIGELYRTINSLFFILGISMDEIANGKSFSFGPDESSVIVGKYEEGREIYFGDGIASTHCLIRQADNSNYSAIRVDIVDPENLEVLYIFCSDFQGAKTYAGYNLTFDPTVNSYKYYPLNSRTVNKLLANIADIDSVARETWEQTISAIRDKSAQLN